VRELGTGTAMVRMSYAIAWDCTTQSGQGMIDNDGRAETRTQMKGWFEVACPRFSREAMTTGQVAFARVDPICIASIRAQLRSMVQTRPRHIVTVCIQVQRYMSMLDMRYNVLPRPWLHAVNDHPPAATP